MQRQAKEAEIPFNNQQEKMEVSDDSNSSQYSNYSYQEVNAKNNFQSWKVRLYAEDSEESESLLGEALDDQNEMNNDADIVYTPQEEKERVKQVRKDEKNKKKRKMARAGKSKDKRKDAENR